MPLRTSEQLLWNGSANQRNRRNSFQFTVIITHRKRRETKDEVTNYTMENTVLMDQNS